MHRMFCVLRMETNMTNYEMNNILDCLSNAECATGASCNAGVCECNSDTPVLTGDSASDIADICVECTATDFGSCDSNDSCDDSTNLCVGECLILRNYI